MDVASLVIYCADIGSIATDKFGWARDVGPGGNVEVRRGGSEIDVLASSVAEDLDDGRAVALGFECPQYIPVAELPRDPQPTRWGGRKNFVSWCRRLRPRAAAVAVR